MTPSPKKASASLQLEDIQKRRKFWEEDKEWFGEPCPTYDPECVNCIHWEMVDYMRSLESHCKNIEDALINAMYQIDFAPTKEVGAEKAYKILHDAILPTIE